jgi:hypothetical protein
MQKKKPCFQVIPDYGVSRLANWNESKCLRNKAGMHLACATSPDLFCAINRYRQTIATWAEFQHPHTRMVRRNSVVFGAMWARIRQPCSLNFQAKYETLCAGRLYSLS